MSANSEPSIDNRVYFIYAVTVIVLSEIPRPQFLTITFDFYHLLITTFKSVHGVFSARLHASGYRLYIVFQNQHLDKFGHYGKKGAESELGVGTTLMIYFPASEKEMEKLEPIQKIVPEKSMSGIGRILARDDEKMIR